MKFSLDWLKEHLETDATRGRSPPSSTRIGIEVEGVEDPAEQLAGLPRRRSADRRARIRRPTSCRC